jgi:hypothetical protein
MRRRRKDFFDEMLERFEELFKEVGAFRGGASSMYSISMTYDDYGRPVIRVSAQGDVNKEELGKYLRERYPNAKIVWEGGPEERSTGREGHIREVTIEEGESLRQKRARGVEIKEVDVKRSKVVEVKVEEGREERRKWYDIKVE